MLPLRRSVTAIFGNPRFRNAVAPISFHPHNSVGEREKERRWYSAKPDPWDLLPPKLKCILFGYQYASIEKTPPSFEEYFWNNFGKYLQLEEDRENDKRIAKALRFFSSQSDDDMISLDDYVENMLPEQKDIFYLNAAHSVFSANNYITPFLKILAENNVEVLFLANPIDEVVIQNLISYKGGYWMDMKSLIGIAYAEQKGKEILKQKFGPTCELINKHLGEKVSSVQISMKRRLSRPPCVLVTGRPIDWSANMERLMKKSQTVDHVDLMRSKRVFEINPQHLIIRRLHDALEDKVDEKHVHKIIDFLLLSALVALGFGGLTPGARVPRNEQIFLDTVYNAIDFCGRSKSRC